MQLGLSERMMSTRNFLTKFAFFSPNYWPQDIDFDYSVKEVRLLCNRFGLVKSSTLSAYQEYVDIQGRRVPDDLYLLLRCCCCIPVLSAECERGFGQMNLISTFARNRFLSDRISNLMFVKLHSPPIDVWNPVKYAKSWLRAHHSADDQII